MKNEKYKKNADVARISEVFESVALQVGGKFVYTKAATQASVYLIKEALELLILAGLVVTVTHTAANGIPIGAERDIKKRKCCCMIQEFFKEYAALTYHKLLFPMILQP